MAKEATVTVTLRISQSTRDLLRRAAETDHRSMANFVEVLILRHCEGIGLTAVRRRAAKPRKE